MVRLIALIALPLFIFASAALAQPAKRVGVQDIAVSGDLAALPKGIDGALYGRRLAEMIVADMSVLLRDEPQFKGCDASVELTNASEPGTGSGAITHLVGGKVEIAGPEAAYDIASRTVTGPQVGTDGGFNAGDPASFPVRNVALTLLKAICDQPEAASKPSRIVVNFNDLAIDQVVCDLKKPFKLSGLGPTKNIHFILTPSDDKGGEWTVSGTAAGVTWDGQGTYSFPMMEDGFGTIELTGAWKLTSPMGVFGTTDTMPGTVMPDEVACKQMY